MAETQENLDRFFDSIARLSFWRRLFGWSAIRRLSYDAFRELSLLRESITKQVEDREREHAKEQIRYFEKEQGEARAVNEQLRSTIGTLNQEVTVLREREDQRETELRSAITSLQAVREQIAAERGAERDAREAESRERLERMRTTWRDHEQSVRDHIKLLCQRHTVEYVDVVPFHGSPDNTILIADEYVVFDAKSPANDDLRNFPAYLKAQAEAARKYAKEEKVKREIYFVVPTQTLSILQSFAYSFQDHTVYVVSVDALEPILLSLRKIQEYEFAEQLSPEERENIIRIIARFLHMTKRRIQVDAFFSRQFLDAIGAAEADLQEDLLSEIHESERTLKLNPPQDQRTKLLTHEELKERQDHIDREIDSNTAKPQP